MSKSRKPRIAIIGGGPAGLSAAFHLSSGDGGGKYDITVYQLGWRLGGKGATGRDPEKGWRIQEHGIHGFCSFYFNTFRMMNAVWNELSEEDRAQLQVKSIDEAFLGSSATYSVELVDRRWHDRLGYGPYTRGLPWEDERTQFTAWHVAKGLARQLLRRGRRGDPKLLGADDLDPPEGPEMFSAPGRELQLALVALLEHLEAEDGETEAAEDPFGLVDELSPLLERYLRGTERLLQRLLSSGHTKYHHTWTTLDFYGAVLTGLRKEGFWKRDFNLDRLDCYDFRAWLQSNGASKHTLASSIAFSIPNTLFAYPGGDTTGAPLLSTSSWLNFVMRSLVGRGEYSQCLAAGTGESVIMPLYVALKNRGVKFEFFHRLVGVASEKDQNSGELVLEKLVFERQDRVKDGDEYDPREFLKEAKRPGYVWPDQPRWKLLKGVDKKGKVDYEDWKYGDEGNDRRVLTHGAKKEGFDYVVWAIPPSMIAHVGDELMKGAWSEVTNHLTWTATQAVQLWLTEDTQCLGWPRTGLEPKGTSRYASASFPNPLYGMVAYDDLLEFEAWGKDGPNGLFYMCAPIQEWAGQTRAGCKIRVLQSASASLRTLGNFLVGARAKPLGRPDPQSIDFGYLFDPENREGEERLGFQYARVNTRPTEAYVQAPPGGINGRIHAWDAKYSNLVVAGDWIYTGINLGAFESAVTGGKLAAFALTGTSPTLDQIVGFDFFNPHARQAALTALKAELVPKIKSRG